MPDPTPDVECVSVHELDSGDIAEIELYTAGSDAMPVRLRVGDADASATAWMTADEADDLATWLKGVAERARREGRQA